MERNELEHIIRAACAISNDKEIIIVGSQSILGAYPNAPPELKESEEADVYPKNYPERYELIEGSIGEMSFFQETFGYYADGVDCKTSKLPKGWEERLIPVCNENTLCNTGYCIEPHDLAISKYIAGREKDHRFNQNLINYAMVEKTVLLERLYMTETENEKKETIKKVIERQFSQRIVK